MTDSNVEEKDPFLAMLRSMQLEERADYLSRGRQLRHVATDELERRWIGLMREWSNDFGGFVYTARHREQLDRQLTPKAGTVNYSNSGVLV